MPQVSFVGSAEVVKEDYYEFETPPNVDVKVRIEDRVFLVTLRENKKKEYRGYWYNDCSIAEIIGGHV